jgi:protein TonB
MLGLLRNALAAYGAYKLYQRFANPGRSTGPNDDGIFKIVEEMPLYGLDAQAYPLPEYDRAKRAADKRMLKFIYDHLSYPALAREAGKDGMAVVSFIVRPTGKADSANLVRDPGYGMGEAALGVVRQLIREGQPWRPGYQRGRAVAVQFNMPIKFRLPASSEEE